MRSLISFASTWACTFALVLFMTAPAMADDTAVPPVLIVVLNGDDGQPERELSFDRDDLAALPVSSFETRTIWTDGLQRFTGVSLRALLDHLDLSDGLLEMTAQNEYYVDFPIEEARTSGALIAYQRNGKPMSARDKGPLWLVFNYDSDPELRSETVYARSIWQLDRIEVSR